MERYAKNRPELFLNALGGTRETTRDQLRIPSHLTGFETETSGMRLICVVLTRLVMC
jgi:hypothetical protein